MESQPRFFSTKSGLQIAYEEYGALDGEPVIFCHGWPGSRLQAALADDAARELGLRIISPDRPGLARSQFQPQRTLLDWPPLVAELAQSLGIERYRLFGISGGGPYALATAWANREAVKAAVIASGAVPLADLAPGDGLFAVYRLLINLHRKNPALVRLMMRAASPLVTMPLPRGIRARMISMQDPIDRNAFNSHPVACDICFRNNREAWSNARGAAHDGALYAEPWGFSPGEIRVPVRFWHGKKDSRFSWQLAAQLASGIPCSSTHFIDGEGHNSLPITRMRDILADLKNAA
ncbi:MAG TPA: alpha/beta hydrolase [Chthoniobacteraceae bacterium]|nr:alpha/beta hydrolase [Chthoniobacteraceae bacterium]